MRLSNPSRRMIYAALATVAAVASGVATTIALSGERETGFKALRNEGSPVGALSPGQQRTLENRGVDASTVRLYGARDGLAVYAALSKSGAPCYMTGTGDNTEFGFVACRGDGSPDIFPSKALPLLDFSPLMLRAGTRAPTVSWLAGLASNSVAKVGVLMADGSLFTVPVTNNVYLSREVPPTPAKAIMALDSNGQTVYQKPLERP